jgi:hypothetical protein
MMKLCPGTTARKHVNRRFKQLHNRLLRNKIQTCLTIVKLLHKQSNHTTHDQPVCATTCVAQTVWPCVYGPLDNVLFEPNALALRKSGTTPGFYACDGLRDTATCVASHRVASTTWWAVSSRRLTNETRENGGDEWVCRESLNQCRPLPLTVDMAD